MVVWGELDRASCLRCSTFDLDVDAQLATQSQLAPFVGRLQP